MGHFVISVGVKHSLNDDIIFLEKIEVTDIAADFFDSRCILYAGIYYIHLHLASALLLARRQILSS